MYMKMIEIFVKILHGRLFKSPSSARKNWNKESLETD